MFPSPKSIGVTNMVTVIDLTNFVRDSPYFVILKFSSFFFFNLKAKKIFLRPSGMIQQAK